MSMAELTETAASDPALDDAMHRFLLAEEARGVFSEHVLLAAPYPLLDWAPDCRREGGSGGGRGGGGGGAVG